MAWFGFGKSDDTSRPSESQAGASAVVSPGQLPAPSVATSQLQQPQQPAGGNTQQAVDAKDKKKICCSCPETKGLRDNCIAERGEEHPYCKALITAHKECLRLEGFKV